DVERLALGRHRVRRRSRLLDPVVVHLAGRVARRAVELVGAELFVADGAIAVAVEQAHEVRAVRAVVDGGDDAGGVAGDDRTGTGPAGAGELVEGRADVVDGDRTVDRAVRAGVARVLGVVVVGMGVTGLDGMAAP